MPEKHTQYQERLARLRGEVKKQGLSGFILPRTDEFQGEFLAPYAERLAWLSGFTGSAGAAAVLLEKACIFSDGRYTIQLKNEVDLTLYNTEDIVKTSVGDWLATHAETGEKIGYDDWLYTPKQIEVIEEKLEGTGVTLVALDSNPIDKLWQDQPEKPKMPVTIFPDEIAGLNSQEKRMAIADKLVLEGYDACLFTMGDSICWLLNVRGTDISYSPLMLSYALLYANGSLDWFIDGTQVSKDVSKKLGDDVRVRSFKEMEETVQSFKGQLCLDRSSCPLWFEKAFKAAGVTIIDTEDPCVVPKSQKTPAEQKAIFEAHIHDGVAIVKFLKWLDGQSNDGGLDELGVEEKLEKFRRENSAYLGPSFSTIAGFNANGAIVHYRATEISNEPLMGDGLLLLDSGGQYEWGTTDITRTMAIGQPSQEMKENYTRVLQGHIALAAAEFKEGTVGKDVDALARKPLQEIGLDYAHGTGHGVGCYLCVHEIAANISTRGERAFEEGMLISNEPGYYKEGEYGIRIENLVLVREDEERDQLFFETVTRAPLDPKLIEISMLNVDEKAWIETYSRQVYEDLSPYLNDAEKSWLRQVTIDINL